MTEKKKSTNGKAKPEKVIQVGECYAAVQQTVTNSGFRYRYFEVGRTWQASTGKQQSGTTFFPQHQRDLADCVAQASAYIADAERQGVSLQ